MKHLLVALSVAVAAVSLGLAPSDADAKRLGSGKPAGMQRQAPPPSATPNSTPPTTAPTQAAAPAAAAATTGAAAAAAAPKRNWLGPVAGLAAGLGLAALASHFGFGEGLANFMTMALLAIVAVIAIRFLMNRFGKGAQRQSGGSGSPMGGMGGPQLAGAGAPVGGWQAPSNPSVQPAPMQRSALEETQAGPVGAGASTPLGAVAAAAPLITTLPGGMDRADFERLAKMVFIRMQAANDAANLDDLRKFTTPELFASLRLDLQERGAAKQQTDVVEINAQVAEVVQENGQDIVTVRFTGLIRETPESGADPFHELWHLVRPATGGDWAIAGITPVQ